jgi:uncharacterized membrane protein YjfL (UPF0719 family)
VSLQQVIFGLLEFLLSIFTSFILIFGSYRLFLWLTPHFDEERQLGENNAAVGIVLGGIILGEAIVVKQAIYPAMAVALFLAFFVLSVCLLMSTGVAGLTRALIPFPEVGTLPLFQ